MFEINYKKWSPWAKRNSLWLILAAIVLALLILAAAFYFNIFIYRDSLVKKAPADSLVYWHFNLLSALDDYRHLDNNLLDEQLDKMFDWPGGQFTKEIRPLVGREAALVVVPGFKEDTNKQKESFLGQAILIRLMGKAEPDEARLKSLGISEALLDKHILAIADSSETLAKITATTKDNNLLKIKIVKKGLGKMDNCYLSKGYLDVSGLDKFYKEADNNLNVDLPFALMRLSTNFLVNQNQPQLFFYSKKEGTGFSFQVIAANQEPWLEQFKTFPRVIKYLPPDTLMAWSGFNWQSVIESLKETFNDTDSGLAQSLDNYEKLYRFSWQNDLEPLLNGQGDLVVTLENDPKTEKQKDFIISASSADDPQALARLEETVKEYLAYHLPAEKVRTLPDNSKVTELLTDPSQFEWQAGEDEGQPLSYIKTPNLEFEFVHAFLADGLLVFSNSLEKLKTFKRNQVEPAPDWLNFQKVVRGSFWPRNQQAIFISLKGLSFNSVWQKIFYDFKYLGIVSNYQSFKLSIY